MSLWKGLSPLNKGLVVGGFVLLVSLSLAGSLAVKSNQYVDLYPIKLTNEDVQEMSMVLSDNRIEHVVAPTQDGIQLHPKDRLRARARLTAASLPRRRVFTSSEDTPMTATAAARLEAQRRRLESELVYTLRQVEGIVDARVTLAFPEQNYFENNKPVTASVFLKTEIGHDLNAKSIRGIASLVSHSVPELQAGGVSVLDQHGIEINAKEEPGTAEMELRATEEKKLQAKLQEALSKIYGRNVHAVVDLTLDFSQEERRTYTPGSPADDGVVKDSIQLVSEMLEGTGGKKEDKNYENRKEAVNYKYTENYFARLRQIAETERISATVLVDGASEAEIEEIQGIVRGSIGIVAERGDEIFVSGTPWNREQLTAWDEEPMPIETLTEPAKTDNSAILLWLVGGLSCGCVLLVSGFLLNRQRMPIVSLGFGGTASKNTSEIVDHNNKKDGSRTVIEASTQKHGGRLEALEELVGSEPNKVASLLRSTWLN